MEALEAVMAARDLLEQVTPLRTDCGRYCGGACCLSDEDGQGGMLLVPGEGDPARQPIPPLRLTLKCLDGADTDALIRLLPPLLALHQRRGEPLPRSAGMLIAGYLKGETPC